MALTHSLVNFEVIAFQVFICHEISSKATCTWIIDM